MKKKLKINFQIVLYPDSRNKMLLDILMMFNYLILLIFLPFRVAFSEDDMLKDSQIIDFYYYIGILVLIVHMVTSSITGYYQRGQLIVRKREIFRNYYQRGELLLDILILLLFVLGRNYSVVYMELPILFKTQKIPLILNQIQQNFQFKEKMVATINLCQLAFQILIIAHICGCAFYLCHVLEVNNGFQTSWITHIGLTNSDWTAKYVASLYWSVVTMVTLGYGDIVPVTNPQRIFVIFFTLFSSGLFGYTINHIGNILQKLEQKNKDKLREISLISGYLRQRNLTHDLLMKCRRYLEYLSDANDQSSECEDILDKLGNQLKFKIKRDIYSKIIHSSQFFSLNFSLDCLASVSDLMSERKFGPDDIVYQEGEFNDQIYFVMRGQLVIREKITEIAKLDQGMNFGKVSFLKCQPERNTVICKNVVTLALIQRDDFIGVLKKFPQDYEQFCELKDNLINNLNTDRLDLNCVVCGNFRHDINNCPLVTYVPNRAKTFFRENQSTHQMRGECKNREETRNTNPQSYIDYLHDAAADLILDIELYGLNYEQEQKHIDKIYSVREKDQSLKSKEQYNLDKIFADDTCFRDESFQAIAEEEDETIEQEGKVERVQTLVSFDRKSTIQNTNIIRKSNKLIPNFEMNSGNLLPSDGLIHSNSKIRSIQTDDDVEQIMPSPIERRQNDMQRRISIEKSLIHYRNSIASPLYDEIDTKANKSLRKSEENIDKLQTPSPQINLQRHQRKLTSIIQIKSSKNIPAPSQDKIQVNNPSTNSIPGVHSSPNDKQEYQSETICTATENDNISEKSSLIGKTKRQSDYQILHLRDSYTTDQVSNWSSYQTSNNLTTILKINEITKNINFPNHFKSHLQQIPQNKTFLLHRLKSSKIHNMILNEQNNQSTFSQNQQKLSYDDSYSDQNRRGPGQRMNNLENLEQLSQMAVPSQKTDNTPSFRKQSQSNSQLHSSNHQKGLNFQQLQIYPLSDRRGLIDSDQSPQNQEKKINRFSSLN